MGEHYITAIAATDGYTFVACRCGWFIRTTGTPVVKWQTHREERMNG